MIQTEDNSGLSSIAAYVTYILTNNNEVIFALKYDHVNSVICQLRRAITIMKLLNALNVIYYCILYAIRFEMNKLNNQSYRSNLFEKLINATWK